MSEASLQKKVMKRLKKEVGGWWVKMHGGPFQSRGLPDIIGCVKGKFIGVELKVPGNKPTELQEAVIDKINKEGEALAFWSDNADHIIKTIKEYIGEEDKHESTRKVSTKGNKRNRS